MSSVTFSCEISAPLDAALCLEILCDGVSCARFNPVNHHDFQHVFDDTVELKDHVIEFVMSNKTIDHTKVDDQGNIISDSVILIKNKRFESIDVDYAFDSRSVYLHDFNGTQSEIQDSFSGIMGCNGRVRFEFTTPIYLWMLENL
jgi:hypothetical protein